MQTTGNTILITGGGSGIGRGLAEAFHSSATKSSSPAAASRSSTKPPPPTPAWPPPSSTSKTPPASPPSPQKLTADYPTLNVVINNAGIMRPEDLLNKPDAADAEAIVATNLLGPIRLTAALLPHLQKQPHATIMTVSSGLAFMPLALTPTYCATKAAIHS